PWANPPGSTTTSTPCNDRSPCHTSSAVPPRPSIAATTSCSQLEPGNNTTPTRLANGDVRVFYDRVREEAFAQFGHEGAGGGLVGRLHHEADGLAHAHTLDAREAERGQRPLDRRALRVGDALPQLHLHEHRELHGVSRAPGHSESDRPVMRS